MRNGYRVMDDPEDASFILQANILKVGKTDPDEANSMLGGVIEGAVIGGAIGWGTSTTSTRER